MDIGQKYPALSRLASTQGFTLEKLAEEASPQDGVYLRLCDCCKMVKEDWPRWRVDPYHYLATIDKFLKFTNGTPAATKIWNKLTSKRLFQKAPSIFLDTVAEAAWALHFFNKQLKFNLEVPFDRSDPNSMDADILLELDSRKYWLDVINVEFMPLRPLPPRDAARPGLVRWSMDTVIEKIASRAIKKYNGKFRKALLSGSLKGASTGILLCFVKSELQVIPPILPHLNEKLPPPSALFTPRNVGLDLVFGYTLIPSPEDEYLLPHTFFEWIRKAY